MFLSVLLMLSSFIRWKNRSWRLVYWNNRIEGNRYIRVVQAFVFKLYRNSLKIKRSSTYSITNTNNKEMYVAKGNMSKCDQNRANKTYARSEIFWLSKNPSLCEPNFYSVGTKEKLPTRGRSKSIYQLNEIRSDFTNNYY